MTISVTQLGNFLKAMVDSEVLLYDLSVEGEISSFRRGGEAAYFILKDDNAQIDCFWYGAAKGLEIKNGDKVIVSGKPNYYIKGGKLSFGVASVKQLDTKGKKFSELLALKEKLEKLGLFDELKKKPIVRNSRKIGIVTSADGAVAHDIEKVAHRRNPTVDIFIYDTRVQGAMSAMDIEKGINFFSTSDVDNVIVARGGGSDEDLAVFNSEIVVRAVASCLKPVISAVGHETNFTLCDFAADIRAATPSVAGELCTQNILEIVENLLFRLDNSFRNLAVKLSNEEKKLTLLSGNVFKNGNNLIREKEYLLKENLSVLGNLAEYKLNFEREKLMLCLTKLEQNNPAKLLKQGYGIVEKDRIRISSVDSIRLGDTLDIFLSDGKISSSVLDIEVRKNEI